MGERQPPGAAELTKLPQLTPAILAFLGACVDLQG
jgi:hypothetical protein